MRQLARVTMTMRDLDRLKCIQAVVDGNLKPGRAAERLGLTTRQVHRLTRRYAREGPVGLISRHRNRPSNNPELGVPVSASWCRSMAASIVGSRTGRRRARR